MKHPATPRKMHRQRGVIMVVALITLVVLLIGAVAMMRSMSNSLTASGAYGFKRDMANQGARAMAKVRDLVVTGSLASAASRQSDNLALNYTATMLTTSAEGIPVALLADDAGFAAAGVVGNDIHVDDMQVVIRYTVDRLCTAAGPASDSTCMIAGSPAPTGGVNGNPPPKPPPPQAVYRLTVRVTGPRNAQAFYQSTFTV